jgi:hypothetical protein
LLGAAIVREFAAAGWEVVPLQRGTLDVTDIDAVLRQVADARPDPVVNCVAYNDVDGAEKDPITALQVNGWRCAASPRRRRRLAPPSCITALISSRRRERSAERRGGSTEPAQRIRCVETARGVVRLGSSARVRSSRQEPVGEPGPDGSRQGSLKGVLVRRAGEQLPVFVDRTVPPG